CVGRSPAHPAVCARWGVRRVEPDGAKPTQATGQNAGGGVPAFQLQCGRAQRIPLAEESPASRTRPPPKAYVPHTRPYLFPFQSCRDDRGRAVFRTEPPVDVCCHTGISRDTPCASESAATSRRLDYKGIGWPAR